jgi:hypothetical protein
MLRIDDAVAPSTDQPGRFSSRHFGSADALPPGTRLFGVPGREP